MSRAHLTLSYDGDALRDGVMDVRDLAPALLAVGQLFEAASAALNRDDTSIKVQVRATGAACFRIDLDVAQSVLTKVEHFLSGELATSANNLSTLLFGSGLSIAGVVGLIKWLRGGKPTAVVKQEPDTARVTAEDGTTLDVPLAALRLYGDLAVRGALDRVVAEPLRRDGIDRIDVSDATGPIASVTKSEAGFFARPVLPDEAILETTSQAAYSIISLAFKEDNKWRLSDGASQISARIEDQTFLDRVESNQIAFAKGDILVCTVRITATQTAAGLKTDYVVVSVDEYRPALRQLDLFRDATRP